MTNNFFTKQFVIPRLCRKTVTVTSQGLSSTSRDSWCFCDSSLMHPHTIFDVTRLIERNNRV